MGVVPCYTFDDFCLLPDVSVSPMGMPELMCAELRVSSGPGSLHSSSLMVSGSSITESLIRRAYCVEHWNTAPFEYTYLRT